jgi:hypothetical protein
MTKELKKGKAEEEGRRLFSEEVSAGQKKQNRPIAGKEAAFGTIFRSGKC